MSGTSSFEGPLAPVLPCLGHLEVLIETGLRLSRPLGRPHKSHSALAHRLICNLTLHYSILLRIAAPLLSLEGFSEGINGGGTAHDRFPIEPLPTTSQRLKIKQ